MLGSCNAHLLCSAQKPGLLAAIRALGATVLPRGGDKSTEAREATARSCMPQGLIVIKPRWAGRRAHAGGSWYC